MKSKSISVFILMFMACSVLIACKKWYTSAEPSATIESKRYSYEQIRGISVANGIILNYSPTKQKENVLVTGPKNVLAVLEIKKDDNRGKEILFIRS